VTNLPESGAWSLPTRSARLLATAVFAISCSFALGGCVVPDTAPPQRAREGGSGLEIPCDPKRVLETVCQTCHSAPPQNSAPFPLVTYDDTHVVNAITNGKPIWHYMLSAVQSGLMPLTPVQINAGDRDALLAWLNAGAPARTPTDMCSVVSADPGDAGFGADSDAAATDSPDAALEADAGPDSCGCDASDNGDVPPE
jgi:hypothetical protein